ncbi:hypothetical protein [Alteromonas sp. a30]|uniref:hypothetical protein n=1 Tax=Alteromonas sp. a30 TaxID=2730917 RepID=UPI00227EA602|nr:hypothetical protein [Alteromonas sp. a30]MCY7297045.1 hypothetical protein [Alteromonas sp. a30]
MTGLEVIDSAVKIGLGALIAAFSSYFTLKLNQSFEERKRTEEQLYRNQAERKSHYVEFAVKSHTLLQKYAYISCNPSGSDYLEYLKSFNSIQILAPDSVREVMSEAFNAITVFIIRNKDHSIAGNSSKDLLDLNDNLMKDARLKLSAFQKFAQLDVTQVYAKN